MPDEPTDPPTDPETLEEYLDRPDHVDDEPNVAGDASRLGEIPEADAAEQRRELLRLRDTPLSERAPEAANPADVVEQSQVVDPGDDEYR